MGIPPAMPPEGCTHAQVATLTQWLSQGFPVGAYSYSHGLEWAVCTGAVATPDALGAWLGDILRHGAGRADAIFLAAAFAAEDLDALRALDAQARAFAPSSERLLETTAQGAAFGATAAAVWPRTAAARDLCHPIALGCAARAQDIPLRLTAQMYLHAFAANLVSAGIRAIPIGQTAGQGLIAELAPLCRQVADEAIETPVSDIASTTFLADIASMKHETQHSRIFRS